MGNRWPCSALDLRYLSNSWPHCAESSAMAGLTAFARMRDAINRRRARPWHGVRCGTSLRALPDGRRPIPDARPGPAHQQMLPIEERWHQNRLRQQPAASAAPERPGQMPGAKQSKEAGKKPGTRKRGFQVYAWAPRRYEGKTPSESGKYVPAQRPSSTRELPYGWWR